MAGYDVHVASAEAIMIASARGRASARNVSSQLIGLLDKVYAYLERTGIPHLGINIALYDGSAPGVSFESDEGILLQAGVTVPAEFTGDDTISCSRTPSGLAVTTAHIGPYDQLSRAYEAIRAWARANGHALSSVGWEVYGHWTDDPRKLRTDVWCLLA